jgi:heptosyltransferase-3
MRILVITSNRIGDAVITCGVLDHLIRTYPACAITIACGPVAQGVFTRMPNRERTILIEKRPFDLHWPALWWQVVWTAWDLVVDFRGSAMAYLVPTRRRAVRRRMPGRMFEQHAALLDISPAPLPVVWTDATDRARAAALVPGGRPVLGLGPTANWPPKAWPVERFVQLVASLTAGPLQDPAGVVFAGPGARERALAEPLLAALPQAIDLCGRVSLSEAAACLQRCTLFVGNDSGLMHLAAASGTPTIGLCGVTIDRAEEMPPAGRFAAWAVAPAMEGRLMERPSMQDLSVEVTYDACVRMLARMTAPSEHPEIAPA